MLRRAKRLLCRHDSLLDPAGRKRIAALVEQSADLKLIYDFKMSLLEVWKKRGGNAEEMLQALKEWCVKAETSGMQALHEFAEELRSYAIPARTAHA